MTIRFRIFKNSAKWRNKIEKKSCGCRVTLYVRLRDGAKVDQTIKTSILVNPLWWDSKREIVSSFSNCPKNELTVVNQKVAQLRDALSSAYVIDKAEGNIDGAWLAHAVNKIERHSDEDEYLFSNAFECFLQHHELSPARRIQYEVLGRTVERFEAYCTYKKKSAHSYHINIKQVNSQTLEDLWDYFKNEHTLFEKYPGAFAAFPDKKTPKPRSTNTMNDLFKKLRTFFIWCVKVGKLESSPFDKFRISSEVYGTPIYLTQDEVKTVAGTNLRKWPSLEKQRDVFVFQCNVGCRVGDLMRLKKPDVADGTVTYIPHKTIKERPQTIVVPLNSVARSIVDKYADLPGEALLPFISPQKYNGAIKTVLEKAGITRTVAILEPLTRTDKKVRICDVASSHMARRTFAGNLYRQVKDPALVAALTGHVEGSKAFSRYRAIDDGLKRELVQMLE